MSPLFHVEQLLLPGLMAISFAACSLGNDMLPPPHVLADLEADPTHFVVVTVRNEPAALDAGPGSSHRDYPIDPYTVAGSARRTADRLGRDYGLRQTTAWPIRGSRLYCIVFQLSTSQGSADMITRLVHDPRVNSAQPLNEFQTQSDELQPAVVDCR